MPFLRRAASTHRRSPSSCLSSARIDLKDDCWTQTPMFPHQWPVVMSGFMWYFPDQRKYSSRCCLAFNWIQIFFLLITLVFLILDFREKLEQLKPFPPREMSGRPTCVVMLFKSTKVYRQVYQTRENATAPLTIITHYGNAPMPHL